MNNKQEVKEMFLHDDKTIQVNNTKYYYMYDIVTDIVDIGIMINGSITVLVDTEYDYRISFEDNLENIRETIEEYERLEQFRTI